MTTPSMRLLSAAGGRANVSDTFTRADSASSLGVADTGQSWTAYSGTWGISSNQAYLVTDTPQAVAGLDSGFADLDMTCDITLSSTLNQADAGIVFRLIDNNNYLLVIINKVGALAGQDSITMYKRDGGSFTQLGAAATAQGHTNGSTYELRVVANGSSVTAYRDGVSKVTHTLSAGDQTKFGAAAVCGIRIHAGPGAVNDDLGTRIDNFTVEAP